jgi:nucleolar protein 14
MTVEDKMLERYTRERQRGQGKKGLFNLEDDDGLDGFDEGLTHGGRNVLDLPGDDFMMQGLGEEDDEEKMIDRRTVNRAHFGGFEEPEEERVKSKQEVMAEIIAKSKGYKVGLIASPRTDRSMRGSSSES